MAWYAGMNSTSIPESEPIPDSASFAVSEANSTAFFDQLTSDLDVWSAFCIPHIASNLFPDFYHVIWKMVINKLISLQDGLEIIYRFALGLPRGFAKTTFLKLIVAAALAFKLRNFPLIVSSNEHLAERLIADIVEIMTSENVVSVFGPWHGAVEKDTQSTKIGHYLDRRVALMGIGAGTSIRGVNIRHLRPDFLIMDDMQTKEGAESEKEARALLSWATATLFKIVKPTGAFLFYVGNLYNEDCILYKLKESKSWETLITGAILADGTSLWPEHKPIEVLRDEWEHDVSLGMADVFYAEVQNDPRNKENKLLRGKTLQLEPKPNWFDATFITVDPAGNKAKSDANAVVVHGVNNGQGYILAVDNKVKNPLDVVNKIIEFAFVYRVTLIAIESISYQSTLMFWLDHIRQEAGITSFPPIVELKAWRRSKESRIDSWAQAALSGVYHIVDKHSYSVIVSEAARYTFGSDMNEDNVLDACAYGLDVMNNHKPQLMHGQPAGSLEPEGRLVTGCILDNHAFRSL